jgi:hypothetical protein
MACVPRFLSNSASETFYFIKERLSGLASNPSFVKKNLFLHYHKKINTMRSKFTFSSWWKIKNFILHFRTLQLTMFCLVCSKKNTKQ